MKKEALLEICQESFNSLWQSEMISEKADVNEDTVIIGDDSILDSIAFITLFSEIEDRIDEKTGKEISLVLSEIHDFNKNRNMLTLGILADFIQKQI
jgi:acyl carrier protein